MVQVTHSGIDWDKEPIEDVHKGYDPPKAKFGDFTNEEKKYPSHGYRVLGNQVEIKVRDSKDCTWRS
jgi:hypothetical protein